ncbi:MAG: YdiU family protein [Planctomyces sp.]|nr:YdiU family protein [Planctomyces sp.]
MAVESDLFARLTFDNCFTRELPADPEAANFRRQVRAACYSRVQPTVVREPRLVAWSREMAEELGLTIDDSTAPAIAEVFSGNRLLTGMDPFAMCYGGHQFGNWAGQLGDGRAINLGEVVSPAGRHWTLQLKGAGPTPYSRTADGLAVLRSSLREFLCSEAMFHLGVPTTRALTLVTTGEQVVRDMFYDGNPQREPGAIVCRVAPSFVRFGNFQILSARRETDLLKRLVDFTIRRDFGHLGEPGEHTYARWFAEVCRLTAEMIVHWMRVGFVHGVMNTDNMSILGLTIDYGPYGWLEDYDPTWTPNTTDAEGRRYRFGQQPHVAMWNLAQLANALAPLFSDTKPLQDGLDGYAESFNSGWQQMMASRMGLRSWQDPDDKELADELMLILQMVETDMTIFFRRLATVNVESSDHRVRGEAESEYLQRVGISGVETFRDSYYVPEQITPEYKIRLGQWLLSYGRRISTDGTSAEQRRKQMNSVNPRYVLRNYLAQLAIDQATSGKMSLIHRLLDVLRRPYEEQPDADEFSAKRPEWARTRAGCSMLSCSS